eukprot:492551_1
MNPNNCTIYKDYIGCKPGDHFLDYTQIVYSNEIEIEFYLKLDDTPGDIFNILEAGGIIPISRTCQAENNFFEINFNQNDLIFTRYHNMDPVSVARRLTHPEESGNVRCINIQKRIHIEWNSTEYHHIYMKFTNRNTNIIVDNYTFDEEVNATTFDSPNILSDVGICEFEPMIFKHLCINTPSNQLPLTMNADKSTYFNDTILSQIVIDNNIELEFYFQHNITRSNENYYANVELLRIDGESNQNSNIRILKSFPYVKVIWTVNGAVDITELRILNEAVEHLEARGYIHHFYMKIVGNHKRIILDNEIQECDVNNLVYRENQA